MDFLTLRAPWRAKRKSSGRHTRLEQPGDFLRGALDAGCLSPCAKVDSHLRRVAVGRHHDPDRVRRTDAWVQTNLILTR